MTADTRQPENVTPPEPSSGRPVFLGALRSALGRTSVWFVVWLLQVSLAILPAAAFYSWFRDVAAHRYAPGSLFANLDSTFRADHVEALGVLDSTNARLGAVLAVFAVVLSAFCAGGWLQVFLEQTRGHSLRRFFFGGSRYFGRFLRLAVLSLLVLGFVSWVVYGMPWQRFVLELGFGIPEGDTEKLHTLNSEWEAVRLFWLQDGTFALLFGLVLAWGDYTRTRLALHDTSSALWAGLCTLFAMLRHPIRTLRPLLALLAIELVVVLTAGAVASLIEDEMFETPVLLGAGFLFLIGQLVLMWRIVVRGARYHACVRVSRDIVRPISRPDPWKKSIGGPGGPRYPLEGDDYVTSV